jgi:hypothetical protein
MERFRLPAILFLVSALAIAVSTIGCNGSKTGSTGPGGSTDTGVGEVTKGELKPVEAKVTGTLKGKVTLAGTPPSAKPLNIPPDNKDRDHCLKGSKDETTEQLWRVSDNGGVANVVVWVRAPKGHYFNLSEEQRKPATELVKIEQPHCAFIPHVAVLFPDYYDPKSKKEQATGQKFEVTNSAPITHNTNWTPVNTVVNKPDNVILPPNGGKKDIDLKSGSRAGQEEHLTLKCNIHTWMSAHVWAFDHPFAAVTDKDGSYEIKNVPADTDLEVVYWHESFDKPKTDKVKVDEKGTTRNFEIKE